LLYSRFGAKLQIIFYRIFEPSVFLTIVTTFRNGGSPPYFQR